MNQILPTSPIGRRYLVWLISGLILGIFTGLTFPLASNFIPVFLILLGILLGLLLFFIILTHYHKGARYHLPDMLLFCFVLLSFLFGIFRVYNFDNLQHQALRASAGSSRQYIGVLIDNPTLSTTGKSYGFPVRVLSYQTEAGDQPVSGNIMLYAPTESSRNLTKGNTISFAATLSAPSDAPYLGGFSPRDYLYRQNFLFQSYVTSLSQLDYPYQLGVFDQIKTWGEIIQNSIIHSIDQSFGDCSEESALLKGILLGVEEDFVPEQYQNFIDSGLIHITSVSGMHVVFLSSFFLVLLRKLRMPKRLVYLILFPVLFLFASVTAFSPSVCRSTIMMLLFFLAQLLQREPDSLTSLSVSAAILLLINPYSLTAYSFILSFSSSLGIIIFSPPIQYYLLKPFRPKTKEKKIYPKPFWRRRLLEPVCSSLSMTASCLLGMGYFGMRFFRRITWGSFLSNLCLLPFASTSFLLGLINWPLYYLFPSLSKLIAQLPLQFTLWCINRIADFFSHPVFRIVTPTPPTSAILPYLVFCIAIYFTLKQRSKNNT